MRLWSRRVLPVCLVGFIAGWLAGCLPESEHPIAPLDATKADARLWGAWLNVPEDGFTVAHVLATEIGGLQIITVDHDVEGVGGTDTYEAHVTRLPQGDYLNILVAGSEPGYLVAKYSFTSKDQVTVALAQDAALLQAVRSGALAGKIIEETGGPDLRITASSEQWQAYLAKAPADLFGESIEFKRVGPAFVSE